MKADDRQELEDIFGESLRKIRKIDEICERGKRNSELRKLRDDFAKIALDRILESAAHAPPGCTDPEQLASDAYLYADAMLEARERK